MRRVFQFSFWWHANKIYRWSIFSSMSGISLVGRYKRKYSVFACTMRLKLRISNIDIYETKNFAMQINSQKISDLFKFLQNRKFPIRSCFKSNIWNLSSYKARGSEFGIFWNGKFVIRNSLVHRTSHSNSSKLSLFIASSDISNFNIQLLRTSFFVKIFSFFNNP